MEHIHILEVVTQVFALVGSEDAQGEAEQGPQVHGLPGVIQLIAQVVDLGVAVVAGGDGVSRFGGQNLIGLELAVGPALIRVAGLQETAAAAAAEVVGPVGVHVDEVFFTDHRLHHEAQVLGDRIAECFAHQLAGILNRELDLAFLVPFRAGLQLAFSDPLSIILNDAFDFKFVIKFEFLRSEPDRE